MTTLKELSELIVDCEHKTAPTQDSGYPSIRTPNIGRGRLLLGGVNRVSEETYKLWTQRQEPRAGDLVLAREAPIGNVAIIPPGLKVCLGQRTVLIRPNCEKVNPHYLTYLLLGDTLQGQILAKSNGATVHHLNMSDIRSLDIPPLPSMDVQERIASILSAYDDLIENNTRRITILEQMAQMLYREWFVNFRFPGHEKVRMVESEIGLIPEGWQVSNIGGLIEFQIGGGWGQEAPDDQFTRSAYVIRGTDIPQARSGSVAECPLRYHKESNFASRVLKAWDVVFEVSGGSKGQPVGRALLVHPKLISALEDGVICASFCKLLRPDASKIGTAHFYQYLVDIYSNGEIGKYQVQSTGITNFKFSVFMDNAKLALPPKAIRGQFEDLSRPIMDAVVTLGRQNVNLRATRDLLLPKLVSGEIEVPQAEETMEAVTA